MKASYNFLCIMPFDLVLGTKLNDKSKNIIFNNMHNTERGLFVQNVFKNVCGEGIDFYLCDCIYIREY